MASDAVSIRIELGGNTKVGIAVGKIHTSIRFKLNHTLLLR